MPPREELTAHERMLVEAVAETAMMKLLNELIGINPKDPDAPTFHFVRSALNDMFDAYRRKQERKTDFSKEALKMGFQILAGIILTLVTLKLTGIKP